MKIYINGEIKVFENKLTALSLIKLLGYEGKKIALEINQAIIPRSSYENKIIVEGDSVEIINAVGGG